MENKKNDVSERISSLSYTTRLSLWFLAISVVIMFSSFIFSWMIQPAIYFTTFSIGAVFGLLHFDQQAGKNDIDDIDLCKGFINIYFVLSVFLPIAFMLFSDLRSFADDLWFLIAGPIFSISLVKKHLEKNADAESNKIDDSEGFVYFEETPIRIIDWRKIRRIALVAALIITPIYFFADYQRNQTEIHLKSKASN